MLKKELALILRVSSNVLFAKLQLEGFVESVRTCIQSMGGRNQ